MPKVNHVKARKDYPQFNIKKGDMCYTWSLKTGPRSSREFRQLTPPRRSQLTTSSFLQSVYDIEDRISDLKSLDDVDDIVQALRDLATEEEEKFDNMPEGLQQSDTGQRIESRKDGCNAAADEIEQAKDSHEDFDEDEPDLDSEEHAEWEARKDEHDEETLEEIRQISINYE